MNNQAIRNHLRPVLDGKFFKIGDDRFYIKGTTYGTFAPDEKGEQFPPLEVVEKDFQLISESGINTIRTYTVPSIAILNLALKYNLKVMVGMPWEQHITFLESKKQAQQIINQLKADVLKCEKHPAIFCYSIGNEIPAPIVRWHGEKKITNFLFEPTQKTDFMNLYNN